MKKLLIILAMIFIGCSESGNSVAVLEFDPTDVENDSTEIDSIATIDSIDSIDTIDSVKEVKDTIINTREPLKIHSFPEDGLICRFQA